MSFDPDPNKQAREIIFSKMHERDDYPPLNFNGNNIQTAISQKHLGLLLDSKLDFNKHINNKIKECNNNSYHEETFSISTTENFTKNFEIFC